MSNSLMNTAMSGLSAAQYALSTVSNNITNFQVAGYNRMVFSLPLLGSELLVRTLNGDTINNSLITEMFFGNCQKLD
ncbi:voltage-gated potassium channel [Yersinia enterocolitica]|nr:voltage-gated potassium channel [Yersinia enterocolitica]